MTSRSKTKLKARLKAKFVRKVRPWREVLEEWEKEWDKPKDISEFQVRIKAYDSGSDLRKNRVSKQGPWKDLIPGNDWIVRNTKGDVWAKVLRLEVRENPKMQKKKKGGKKT